MKWNVKLLVCSVVASAQLMMAQVFEETASKVNLTAVAVANIIVVLGLMLLGGKYLFFDRHDQGSVFHTLLGGVFLLGARAIATQFLPVATP